MRAAVLSALLAVVCISASAERLMPPAPPALKDLVVVDWQVRNSDDRLEDLAVRSLQGLVNRGSARIWVGLDSRPGNPGWWLARYKAMGLVSAAPEVITEDEFLKRYSSSAKGVVIPPADLGPGGYRVAVMKAAAEDLIVGSRDLATKLGLKVVEDYSTRFATYAESWRYALDHLWGRLSKKAVCVDREDLHSATAGIDYVIQQRIFLCAPHAGVLEEMALFRETLSRLPSNSPVMGSVGGKGLCSEGDIVRAVSKAGCVFVPCSAFANLTVHAGMKPASRPTSPARQCPKLDRSKAYVAVEISDGDNACAYLTHLPRNGLWGNRGKVPLGWTMGQALSELAPAVDDYYRSTRTPLDEFMTGVSGYAYMFPGDFANALAPSRKEEAWRVFLKRTDDYLDASGMRTVATLQYQESPGVIGDDVFARYAKGLRHAAGIINGYNAVSKEYGNRTWQVVDALPVFHTVTDRTWNNPGDPSLADEVIKVTPKERPAFLALFMLPFALRQEHFGQVVDSLKRLENEGYVLVLPSELAALLKESRQAK